MVSAAIAAGLRRPNARVRGRMSGALSTLTLVAISVFGVAVFLYPFLLSNVDQGSEGLARAQDAPLIFGVVLSMALLLFVLELNREGMNAKMVSVLAVVIVAAAVLRVPRLPAGASAFDFMVIIGGYVFGARMGFFIGAGALFISAFALGGFGPWLPFQMFACGWLGLTAGWLGMALPHTFRQRPRAELLMVAAFGFVWGFLLGAILNLWFWPFVAQGESISWTPGMGVGTTLRHYWSFYLITSAGWDAWRALGNAALLLVAGRPTINMLVRFRDRFQIRFV